MAKELGVVIKKKGRNAIVRTQRATACDGCSEKSTCHSFGGSREMEVEALNPVNAVVGDTVTIEFGTGRMLKLSLLLYIFPLAALLAGAIIGDLAGSALNLNKSVFSAVTGFAAFFVSLTVLLALEKKAKSLDSYKPSVVAIKQKGSMPEEKCEHRP
jgi:sigma-E factor negative regulatory protein RseC